MNNIMVRDAVTKVRKDYLTARKSAILKDFLFHIAEKPIDLTQYDWITRRLGGESESEIQIVPVNAIVSSVFRYSCYFFSFLPKIDEINNQWAGAVSDIKIPDQRGFPQVILYKSGDEYYVKYGHHRIAIARLLRRKRIHALVDEILLKTPPNQNLPIEEQINRQESNAFLKQTHLHKYYPGTII